jgi:ribosomal subunit interface protein
MQLDIKAKGIELTEAIRVFVQAKMDTLDAKTKRFGDVVRSEVEVGKTTKHHKNGLVFRAEVHVRLPGKVVYAEALDKDLYKAIGAAKKEAEGQIVAYKGALDAKQKRGSRTARNKA